MGKELYTAVKMIACLCFGLCLLPLAPTHLRTVSLRASSSAAYSGKGRSSSLSTSEAHITEQGFSPIKKISCSFLLHP
jgi:hypothetical protein